MAPPLTKDGNGFLSKISPDGKMITAEWVKGFNAPKGLGLVGGTLYVADIDELVAVDIAKGEINETAIRPRTPSSSTMSPPTRAAACSCRTPEPTPSGCWTTAPSRSG